MLYLLLLVCVSVVSSLKYDTASFFGDSFISFPLEEASSTTNLQLRFKTSRQDALLFLAAGDTDYCLVSLAGGRVSVRINLGSGETELISPFRFFFHDLVWHEVRVRRNNSLLTLSVDNTHTVRVKLSGRFHELNVHHGVFVGGLGSFEQLFLGLLDPFRGCMSNVRYNGHNIFAESAVPISTPGRHRADVFAVDWRCSDEFLATSLSPISLLQESSFLSFHGTLPRRGGTLTVSVKTQVEEGILIYATGPPSRSDFISLEIRNRFLLLTIDDGDGVNSINSSHPVSDGSWHSVEAHYSPSLMALTTDGEKKERPLVASKKKYLDLSGYLYFGGMEVNKRARAVQQGVSTAQKSLRGCLKHITVNGVEKGLHNPMVTKGVSKGCQFGYPCLKNPCIPGALCTHVGTNEFRCTCQESLCVRQDFLPTSFSSPQTRLSNFEILKVNPLAVGEGSQNIVSTTNIVITLDYAKFGVLKSGIVFRILKDPIYGEIVVTNRKSQITTIRGNFLSDEWRENLLENQFESGTRGIESDTRDIEFDARSIESDRRGIGTPSSLYELNTRMDKYFSLLDLEQGRVVYRHDGSESTLDSVTLIMDLTSQPGYILPSYLQIQQQVVLPISIQPTNDPPRVELPSGSTLRMARGSVVKLTPTIIEAVDTDNPPDQLVFSVIRHHDGYIKKSRSSESYTMSFSQDDINKGLISYVNTGQDHSKIIMKVSDGGKVSVPAVLEIETYELDIYLVNNTGLNLVHGTSVVILPDNLSCSSNEGEEETDIVYIVTLQPRYGRIEVLGDDGQWNPVREFTEYQIQQLKVRYYHLRGKPKLDKFYFRLSAMTKTWPDEYIFRIMYLTVSVEVVRNAELLISGIQESFISEGYLYTVTHPTPNERSEIVYTLLSTPKFGGVYLSTNDLIYQRRLAVSSNFTQDDITKGRLKYKLNYMTFSNFRDNFQFLVTSMDHESKIEQFKVTYESLPFDGKIISEAVILKEGGMKYINSSNLNIIGRGFSRVLYNLKQTPQHGIINILDERTRTVIRQNASYFSNTEVNLGLVFYKHDDSENFRDVFKFVAITEDARPNFQLVGILRFEILPLNDNAPTKLFDRVLNIVSKSGRVLSASDITFYDPDIATSASQLRFNNIQLSGGRFLKDGRSTESFTQQDINDHSIKLVHDGDSYSKVSVTVSDGSLFVTDYIDIVASEAYIEVINNTGLVASKYARTVMNNWNLSVTTNVDTWNSEVIYNILEHPEHGQLKIMGTNGDAVDSFTENTLKLGSIFYEHNENSESQHDSFKFKVQVQDVYTEGIVSIRVYPESYWDELLPLHNHSLLVEEGTIQPITGDNLNFYHPQIEPQEIVYRIVRPPSHGTVLTRREGGQLHKTQEFSQLLVSSGNVFFRQGHRNVTSDYFQYIVSNGVTDTPVNTFLVQVVPSRPMVFVGSVRVLEGRAVTIPAVITSKILSLPLHSLSGDSSMVEHIVSKLSLARGLERYEVLKQPTHGTLHLKRNKQTRDYFTREQLLNNQLVYSHSGSEDRTDEFLMMRTLIGDDEETAMGQVHHSAPVRVSVLISNENDESPEVYRNEGIELWEDDNVILTRNMLEVTDNDTKAEDLLFECSDPTNGFLAYRDKPNQPITSFSQWDIIHQKIFFKHSGAPDGGFSWRVSDSKHSTGIYVFTVTAKVTRLKVDFPEPFEVLPLSKMTISNRYLKTHFNNPEYIETIYLIIKERPKFGKIVSQKGNSIWDNASTFTQKQIDEGMIGYEQTVIPNTSNEEDYFIFDVESPPIKMIKQLKFNISIKLENSAQIKQLLSLKPIIVSEGGSSSLSEANFNLTALQKYFSRKITVNWNSRLTSTIHQLPVHGKLSVAGRNLHVGSSISSYDIRSGNMIYTHDHSDTLTDGVNVQIEIQSKSERNLKIFNFKLKINISPINDKIFRLEKSAMSVIRFQTKVLSSQDLYTSDEDTLPEEIRYQIMSGPVSGKIIISNSTSDGLIFTQKDIEDGFVSYSNDGTNQSSKLHFQVSDGGHTPKYGSLDINILPLEIKLINLTEVTILQTTSVSRISNANLAAKANTNDSVVAFNITEGPKHGNVYIDGRIVHSFNQGDIDDGKLIYLQSDMTAATDYFTVLPWFEDISLGFKRVNIKIKPLIEIHPVQAVAGSKIPITLHNLNASDLSRVTSTLPLYKIVKTPKFAFLKRLTRNSNGFINSYEINEFTHSDLISSRVYLSVKNIQVNHENPMMDRLHFILSVEGGEAQPAIGVLSVVIHPRDSNILNSIDNPRHLRPDITSDNHNTASSDSTLFLTILAIILSILLTLVIIILAAVFCSRRNTSKDDKDFDEISLPPPIVIESRPDSLLTDDYMSEFATYSDTPNTLTDENQFECQTTPSESSLPSHLLRDLSSLALNHREISPSLPRCRITPLYTDDFETLQVSQIYKDSQGEEYGLYEPHQNPLSTSKLGTPMLRRNQYWV